MHPLTISNTPAGSRDALHTALSQWRHVVDAELKGAAFAKKLVRPTLEGIALQPLYTRADLAGLCDLNTLPGQPPFLRGSMPAGQQRPWRVAQEIGAASAADFNVALRCHLMHGQDSVVVAAGSAAGLLPDLRAMETALEGVDLTAVPVYLEAGPDAFPAAAMYLTHARRHGVAPERLKGSVTADPIGEWIRAGRLSESLFTSYDSLAGWTHWSAAHAPQLRTVGVNGRMWADAGATAVQELAFALSCAADYVACLVERGVAVNAAVARMRFQFSAGPQFFTEIAKFRAWRTLWTRVLMAYGADPTLAASATVHAATARWNKTMLDPHTNMLRVTTEALSAVLGGCDTLHIAPFDEVTGATDDFSQRIARNVHTLLREEFGFTATADPAGGAWYIEKLTDELARKAWMLFQELAADGGFVASLRQGVPQQLTLEAATVKLDSAGSRRLPLVGTNLYPNPKEKRVAANRSGEPAVTPHAQRASAATGTIRGTWPQQFEAALAAAERGGTCETIAALRPRSSPPEQPIAPLQPLRVAVAFEQLRSAAAAYAARAGHPPQVFLAKVGPPAQHKARADFSAGFFATGGFEILGKTFASPEAAAEAAAASPAHVAVLCSTDETYPALVPAFASAAKAHRAGLVLVLAGLPADAATIASYRGMGIDEFIHLRADVPQTLRRLLKQTGVLS